MTQRKTITVTQGSPEWAFLVAQRTLAKLAASGADLASVRLYADGSGELRVPASQAATLRDLDLSAMTGSNRRALRETEDLVIPQCQGFAFRDWDR